ncbi:hypothetical protein BB560_000639 [Smittium megazygosporum]|uniref:RNA cytidine acetyltransferase n=1 Tax=Smittium megazygosporum TaxID=133381 RepID=A0A2T9ZJV1_9FUNG|nr:hypothetical protein BB560_000639 [Smittium megazygosporum]
MVKKAVDPRINTLIRNGVQKNHRSFFVLIGDKGKDQIVNLHWMLTQARTSTRPNVLCHRKKREAKIKRDIKRGIREPNKEDPFEMFITLTDIRYTYYKETENILGNTFGMCILQDFEALTPNLLARTIETVEGGGIVVLLLKSMKSLKQLYTMSMDVHSRYRTEAHNDVVGRFNERFILSLADCKDCLFIDDELNVLTISRGKSVKPLTDAEKGEQSQIKRQLDDLKTSLADVEPIGALIKLAKTYDQAKNIMKLADIIGSKSLRSTVSLTAGRGRGKSATLGITLACAIAHGFSNIFVTSPSPSNLKTLFEFLFKGFDALGYEEHLDYDIIMSNNNSLGTNCVVRVNVFKHYRQTIQYIMPQDSHMLSQAELLVIDEAAAIPLPLVNKLLGPYLVFMSSTINGYEGTGRSLSLKLLKKLRDQSVPSVNKNSDASSDNKMAGGGRQLHELSLNEPIRYSNDDRIEAWLNSLLCLDASIVSTSITGCPHPDKCELFWVNRDTLFSYHPVSEAFLQKMVSLYVASHYKNSPNDLQLLSDAPAHELFVLLAPVDSNGQRTALPEPLCVIQVCLEGQISKESLMKSLGRGIRSGGDLIPWLISQQYQDANFSSLSGARVVRIATHPDYTSMGYGSKALELLEDYYAGKVVSVSETAANSTQNKQNSSVKRMTDDDLQALEGIDANIKVRDLSSLPPLFLRLSEKPLPNLHWLGVSYGLTPSLFKFWKRSRYTPVYLRQTPSELTGEHTVVMLKDLPIHKDMDASLDTEDITISNQDWLKMFSVDFVRRMLTLFSFEFSKFPGVLGLAILEAANKSFSESVNQVRFDVNMLQAEFLPWDIKRLEAYSNNILDYHVILDLIPKIAKNYFSFADFHESVGLSGVQQCILLSIGLQHKSVDDIVGELGLTSSVVLAMLMKIIKKIVGFFNSLETKAIDKTLPKQNEKNTVSLISNPENLASNLANELDEDDETSDDEIKDSEVLVNDIDTLAKETKKLKNQKSNTNTIVSLKPGTFATTETNTPQSNNDGRLKQGINKSKNHSKKRNGENEDKGNTRNKSSDTQLFTEPRGTESGNSIVEKLVRQEETHKIDAKKKMKMSKKTRKF